MNKMGPVFLHQPGVVSALGDDLAFSWQALCQSDGHYLSRQTQWVHQRVLPVGAVSVPLQPFAAPTLPGYKNRTNRLLWHASIAVANQIIQAKQQFGAHRVAVVVGTSTSGADENRAAFQQVVAGQDWSNSGFSQTQQSLYSPADFLAQAHGLTGLCYVISTACTSGARALISAARLLHAGLADAVVCGGVDCLSWLTLNGFAALSVLSDAVATPFGPQRQGINIGEGAAVFVATRAPLGDQDDALRLWGYGASSDAWHMSSPRPDGLGAQQAIQAALVCADLCPDEIGWVNLHGTGTEQNDAMESAAVAQSLGSQVWCTSTKPMTGHTLGAAGALEAAWVWAAASRRINPNGILPKQYLPLGYDASLPHIRLTEAQSTWPSGPRLGLTTSFAFGGSNTALVLGEEV
ncbi:beta-ketoacyl-ACP synthase [Snodgrassella sp. CFCC 13594]|uniref:beta-ketoacyl-ACP synthase n=1 Tax=Snodgrassella sp. CFCC 13594 TaxID=1775559 RepID=UPI00082CDA7A|nr:beta-ketoacyl-ACP synthase [Snodgrassella sp. CFCC 13594]